MKCGLWGRPFRLRAGEMLPASVPLVPVPVASSSARPRQVGEGDGDDGCSTDAGDHGEDDDAGPAYPGVPGHDAGEPGHGAVMPMVPTTMTPPRITRSFHLSVIVILLFGLAL